MAAAKARGKVLGGRRVSKARFAEIRESALQANAAQAQKARAEILPAIAKVRESGASSLRQIAAGLNALEVPTPRGAGEWSAVQVQRVLNAAELLSGAKLIQ